MELGVWGGGGATAQLLGSVPGPVSSRCCSFHRTLENTVPAAPQPTPAPPGCPSALPLRCQFPNPTEFPDSSDRGGHGRGALQLLGLLIPAPSFAMRKTGLDVIFLLGTGDPALLMGSDGHGGLGLGPPHSTTARETPGGCNGAAPSKRR